MLWPCCEHVVNMWTCDEYDVDMLWTCDENVINMYEHFMNMLENTIYTPMGLLDKIIID